jgi:ribosomal protein S18 acetylase RimI-like enzyme
MLEPPLPEFWSAWRRLSGSVRPTTWGEVVTDPCYPLVWESNHAAVLRNHAEVTVADIRAELLPAVETSGAAHEHVEFWDLPAETPALEALRPASEHHGVDAVMVYRGDSDGPGPADRPVPEVTELTDPDDSFWDVYRTSRGEFGGAFGDDIVDELVLRDRQVLVPAGLRAFGANIDGKLAGFVTLISLAGVGYVDNVVTLPAYRRRGVASAGVAAAVWASMASGDAATHLLTEEGSDAQRLYEGLGFEQASRVSSVTRRLRRTERRGQDA